jgi:hypothetical protein
MRKSTTVAIVALAALFAVWYYLVRRPTVGVKKPAATSSANGSDWGRIVAGTLELGNAAIRAFGGTGVGGATPSTGSGVSEVVSAGVSGPVEV